MPQFQSIDFVVEESGSKMSIIDVRFDPARNVFILEVDGSEIRREGYDEGYEDGRIGDDQP